uniref:Uncharacterized protein n=1 Tax=Arundo donax TaxID=35708 RepID=A0A0A9D901_ARUDO
MGGMRWWATATSSTPAWRPAPRARTPRQRRSPGPWTTPASSCSSGTRRTSTPRRWWTWSEELSACTRTRE